MTTRAFPQALTALLFMAAGAVQAVEYHVSPQGDDAWSGLVAAPTAGGNDGPFRTLQRAQAALRQAPAGQPRAVIIHDGVYYLDEPLRFTPADSGSAAQPVVWQAAAGARPVISGGRRLTAPWQQRDGGIYARKASGDAQAADFRQLRIGDRLQTLARHPNAVPERPYTDGFIFAGTGNNALADWEKSVGNIHNVGDWMEWPIDVPVAGDYVLWTCYGHAMKAFNGQESMDGHTAVSVNGGPKLPLNDLPDTGGWSKHRWGRSATVTLAAGKQNIRWLNIEGGGLNLVGFALSGDPAWTPEGQPPKAPATGHTLHFAAASFSASQGKELSVSSGNVRGNPRELPVPAGAIDASWDYRDAQVTLFPAWGWVGGPVQVERYDAEAGLLRLQGRNASQDIRRGNRFFLQNVRQVLDDPGEFYYDRAAEELLYIPRNPSELAEDCVVPVLKELIIAEGDAAAEQWVEHLTFKGLLFQDSCYSLEAPSMYSPDDAAIVLNGARHIGIDDCVFTRLGGHALHLRARSQNCSFLACTVSDMGQGGVIATGDNDTQPADCVIAGCSFRRLGLVYKHVAAVHVTTGRGFRIAHCDMADMPRYAISLKSFGATGGSHGCVIEYNDIRRTNHETNDTGAIETLGRDKALTGHIIRYNLILDSIGLKHTPEGGILTPFYSWGIYLDDYSSGAHIYGNVVARNVRGGYHNHLGFKNVVENNIFVDGQDYQIEWNGRADMTHNVFRRNIICFANGESIYQRSSGWTKATLAECDYNLLWCSGGDQSWAEAKRTPMGTMAEWRAGGYDTHSLIADPLFVDPAQDNFALRPDSPAFALGFEPIPMERIGTRGYQRK